MQLKPYSQNKGIVKSVLKNKKYRTRLEVSITQANDAEKLPLESRVKKYSFITRFKGNIASPHKLSRKYYEKYRQTFKRKFNVDLPEEFSSGDEENHQRQKPNKRKNVIFIGNKKKN